MMRNSGGRDLVENGTVREGGRREEGGRRKKCGGERGWGKRALRLIPLFFPPYNLNKFFLWAAWLVWRGARALSVRRFYLFYF